MQESATRAYRALHTHTVEMASQCDTIPANYINKVPKYHKLLVRSRGFAKRHGWHSSWRFANDVPLFCDGREHVASNQPSSSSRGAASSRD